MKKLINCIILSILILATTNLFAQSKQQTQVIKRVEQLTKAMIDGDSTMLDNLTVTNLIYAHSGGHIENKKQFIHNLCGGGGDFVTIDLTEPTYSIINKKTVISRHTLAAKTNDNGKPADVHLYVMITWVKQKSTWKMAARQAAKIITH